MIEGARFSELAYSCFFPKPARGGLEIRKNSTHCTFSKVLRKSVSWLSKLFRSVGKLAEHFQRASLVIKIMLANLSFELLLETLQLVLAQMSFALNALQSLQHLFRRIVEVSRTTIRIGSFALITTLS